MLIHFFGKNCLWLFAAVQFFSPTQLSRFLVVVMATFILQISFVNGVFAEDVTTTTATDTPIVSTDSTALESVILQAPPSIDMLNTTEGLRIVISAIPTGMIGKYYFDGSDVTSLIAEMVDSGVIKVSEENGSNVMLVSLAQPFLGEHSFTVETLEGTTISKKVILDQPVALDTLKLLPSLNVKGSAYKGCGWFGFGGTKLSGETVVFTYMNVEQGRTTVKPDGTFEKVLETNAVGGTIGIGVGSYPSKRFSIRLSRTLNVGKLCF